MKMILLLLIMLSLDAKVLNESAEYSVSFVPKNMSVKYKKDRFYHFLVPVIQKVHKELELEYKTVMNDMRESKNLFKKDMLKKIHNVKSDEELLMILKPHPQSIVLAQAAMESAWATSRFFMEANNVFGMWSSNKNEPRIAAAEKRDGIKTIWLKKFDTIEDSVKAYYRLLAMGRAYKEFRKLRVLTDNPYELVEKLDKYSEIGELYGKTLARVIRYNKLIKYDR